MHKSPRGALGAIIADEVLNIAMAAEAIAGGAMPSSVANLIDLGKEALDKVGHIARFVENAGDALKQDYRARGILTSLESTRLEAPLSRPGIFLAHGRAYRSHVTEMAGGSKIPAAVPAYPIGFLKNANSIIGPGESIVLPTAAPDQVDFEGELAVVFSRNCHGVSRASAMQHVFGFTIVNDVSARDWMPQMPAEPDLNRMGKQFATFAPMGPCIATSDEFQDVDNLHLVTRLNGEVMQEAYTKDLIWSLSELIEYYSKWYPFRAGDVLTSGTPAGVGYGRTPKVFMRSGDRISVTVDGVGELSNPVIGQE